MVGFIKWLNEMSSVKTLFCCEGDKTGLNWQPYVMLFCEDDEDLRLILRAVQVQASDKLRKMLSLPIQGGDQYNFAVCEVQMDTVSKRYTIKFQDKGNLVKFNEYMKF